MKTQHYWKAILCYARIDCICAIWMEGFDSYVSFVLSRHFHPSILSTLRSRVVSNIGSTNSHSTWTRLLIDSGTEGKRGWLFLDPVQRWSRDWLCDRWHCASSKPRSPVCVYVCVCACMCARVCVCVCEWCVGTSIDPWLHPSHWGLKVVLGKPAIEASWGVRMWAVQNTSV